MMTAEESQVGGGRNVLVGITFDGQGRELLSWAIFKVADQGDQVIAIHVCRKTDDALKEKMAIEDFLEIYRGICETKKVNLRGKILKGNSIRKSLVKEAKSYPAVAVVVGTSKQTALGGWLSAAKYCTKHLPSSIDVVSVHNGKVVFRRSSNVEMTAPGRDPRPSLLKHGSFSSNTSENHLEYAYPELSKLVQCPEDGGDSTNENFSLAPSTKTHIRTGSSVTESNLEQKPGWPLLRKASLPTHSGLEARKMSVVQWVMNLPSRSPPETPNSAGSEFSFSVNFDSPDSLRNSHSFWGETPEDLGLTYDIGSPEFTWFSYEVLNSSTSQFSSENLIGKGGSSRVYKGWFPDGRPVAVKVTKSSKAAWKDFSLEIDIISLLKHKNITPLLGVCIENGVLISVYEFASKGSLEDTLHSDLSIKHILPWEARFKMAVGVADALNYLHSECLRSVIHRDVKSSNILLSDGSEPQLSDFGLAVWGPTDSSFETYSDVVGTFGYLAPEYFMYGKVSSKVDVYSFGVVLLELLSGRKPIDTSKGQESLVMWAKPILESGMLRGILDPNLEGGVDETQMQRMILAATLCLTRSARLRPPMNQILKLLKGEESIEKWTNSYRQAQSERVGADDEVYVDVDRESHLSLALEDEFTSESSMEQNSNSSSSLEEYVRGRWSRSSSFD